MKFIEDQRVGLEPIEKSTRYVNFGSKVGGRYLYYIPKPDLERHGLLAEYTAAMDHLFDTYVALLRAVAGLAAKELRRKGIRFSRRKPSILCAGFCRWRRSARLRSAEMRRRSNI